MTSRSTSLLLLLVTFATGCGDLGSLGELEGTYALTALADQIGSGELAACELTVDRDGGQANCERTSAISNVFHEELAVDLGIGEESLDATIVYASESNDFEGCYVRSCTTTITGEAGRRERRDTGRKDMFRAAAGEWDGTVTVEQQCSSVASPRSDGWCSEAEDTLEIATYTFEASVFESYARVEWIRQEESGGFDVIGYGDVIEVDGVAIPKSKS